jgi:hypothetical protein
MDACLAKDCPADAFLFLADGTIGLCYPHWRSLFTATTFYDRSGWKGSPLQLKDGRRLTPGAGRHDVSISRPPYSGLQFERPAGHTSP